MPPAPPRLPLRFPAAESHAPSCTAVPKKGIRCHKAPKKDTRVVRLQASYCKHAVLRPAHSRLPLFCFPPGLHACSSVSITVTDSSGKVVQTVCPGQSYIIGMRFPDKRLAYVTLSSGKFKKARINTNK